MSYYERHIFFCNNIRKSGKKCCGQAQADAMAQYMKSALKKANLHGEGRNRVSRASCMGRCQVGPVIAIYPDAIWYTYENQQDIDEIIKSHLTENNIVSRLVVC